MFDFQGAGGVYNSPKPLMVKRRPRWLPLVGACGVAVLLSPGPLAPPLLAQSATPCGPVSVPNAPEHELVFTADQETELGRLMRSQLELFVRVIDDPSVTTYLRETGGRLARRLPAGAPRFQFFLADLPYANALSIPGGAVLVSRKMVATLRSEDELAAVLAHEIGHAVKRHGALSLSHRFKKLLGIQRLETAELHDRNQDLIEADRDVDSGRNPEHDEEAADRVGLQILVSAGYSADAFLSVFERMAQLRKGTGNWFSDLLGSTPPNAKRLRALAAEAASTSACPLREMPQPAGSFSQWQAEVVLYRGTGYRESVPRRVQVTQLEPALRNALHAIRISPDGRYVLAQDESTIAVFSREGLRPLFAIDAEGAQSAAFSPDSDRIVFLGHPPFGSPRVEWWSPSDRTQEVYEIHVAQGCVQSRLSPDGTMLVCMAVGDNYNQGATFDLRIVDVETGAVQIERKPFATLRRGDLFDRAVAAALTGDVGVATIAFTPDSRCVLVGNEHATAAFELTRRRAVELNGAVKRLARAPFVFLDNSRLAARLGSRLDTFGGAFGGLVRKIVRSRASGGLDDQLVRLRTRLEAELAGASAR